MTKEYIDREALIEEINSLSVTLCGKELFGELAKHSVTQKIDEQPTADVVEVRHGHFENIVDFGNGKCFGFCSECYSEHEASNPTALKFAYQYCRWCGAKMDGGK